MLLFGSEMQNAVIRFKTEGIENLMHMEEFDDVRMIAEEIDKLEEQYNELGLLLGV